MKKITGYVKDYFIGVDKRILLLSAAFIAVAIFCNYRFHLNRMAAHMSDPAQYLYWYFVFLLAFSVPYLLYDLFGLHRPFIHSGFIILFFIAPLLFSWKMVYDIDFSFSGSAAQNIYWNQVIYWPFKLLVITVSIFLLWSMTRKDGEPLYGISTRNFRPAPYLVMLLLMVPLIAAASTQKDFLAMYPKLKNIAFLKGVQGHGWYKLLYELSYGSDFISIELFFRGFLVLAFVKWFGRDAILPMACFYCTIHFGKPLGECISSFFGGLILGVVTYHTRTIFGGLIVHLGIAWLMELGGYLGNSFFR
ncbi:MAG TPA: CPBP family intramembrane glutamic endopeptidase [Flavisolibacter sp.]|nr:CPBP family intramembrane glutamic endopeptidase [Flavisolibacter sp.]